ncbi:MAG: helix-turn-helix transcriptional regulator [Myxococcales bacterium]|nr:helix-turn-helix transcriptional regulator [Myxococcales bacterium]
MSDNGAPDIDPILDAAAELFEKSGYDDTTFEAVAERSGYARSTVFRRYPTKTALLHAIVEAFLASFPRFVETFFAPSATHAPRPAGPPPPAPSSRLPRRRPSSVPPPPLGPPVGVVIHALEVFAARHGALARVALAAKDLPWCRPLDCSTQPAWHALAERCFDRPADTQSCRILLDALKHLVHGHGACSPDSAVALARTLADLGVLAHGLRLGTRNPAARPNPRHPPPPPARRLKRSPDHPTPPCYTARAERAEGHDPEDSRSPRLPTGCER